MREERNRSQEKDGSWEGALGCRDPPDSPCQGLCQACLAEGGRHSMGGSRTKAPSQRHHGISPLLSPWHQFPPLPPGIRHSSAGRRRWRSRHRDPAPVCRDTEQGRGAGSIAGIQPLPCLCLAFPASLGPAPPSDVVAGKPKQTSLKPLPHDKDRPKLCLNTSDCREAATTLLKKTKTRSKTSKSPAEISYLVLLG